MNTIRFFLGLVCLFGFAREGEAVIAILDIPDNDPNGVVSTLAISGATAAIEAVTLTLNISSAAGNDAWNGDLYAYVTHESGTSAGFAVLLNRPGLTASKPFGYDGTGMAVTFSDTAQNDIHSYQNFTFSLNSSRSLTGLWQPDGREVDPANVLDTSERTTSFDSFKGLDSNGTWTLFVADLSPGGTARLDSWDVKITQVPEPAASAMFCCCILAVGAVWRHLRVRVTYRPAVPILSTVKHKPDLICDS